MLNEDMSNLNFINDELNALQEQNLKRELKVVASPSGPWVELSDGKRVLQFASNNYLGLANHPDLINFVKTTISKYGVGSSGSRLLSGTLELHAKLESELAIFQSAESAILFNSGYTTNISVLSSLLGKDDAVYSDENNHASIIDGIRFSKASKFIYLHNDIDNLKERLEANKNKFKRSFIVTDSVFSMDGDVAKLEEIADLSEKYNCINIVDEAHAIGVFGKYGAGLVDALNLHKYFPIRIGTCSKAIAVEGGFCTGPKVLIELLQNKARAFMFSTSSSPAVLGAVLKSIEIVKDSGWRREKLWNNAKLLYNGLKKNYKLRLCEFQTPIIIVYFDSIEQALKISKRLFEECHIWAPAIRPPTVKVPCIRLTAISTHNEEDINYVIKAFEYVSKDLPMPSISLK